MSNKPSSPVCYAEEAHDGYMGYIGPLDLQTALHEILERVRESAEAALIVIETEQNPDFLRLLLTIYDKQKHWQMRLENQIRASGGNPAPRGSRLPDQISTTDDHYERWLIFELELGGLKMRLDGLRSQVRNERLHELLRSMLFSQKSMLASVRACTSANVSSALVSS